MRKKWTPHKGISGFIWIEEICGDINTVCKCVANGNWCCYSALAVIFCGSQSNPSCEHWITAEGYTDIRKSIVEERAQRMFCKNWRWGSIYTANVPGKFKFKRQIFLDQDWKVLWYVDDFAFNWVSVRKGMYGLSDCRRWCTETKLELNVDVDDR